MEATVIRMIFKSADRLGLAHDSQPVLDAIETGRAALSAGHDVEVSFDAARLVLVRATMPAEMLAVA